MCLCAGRGGDLQEHEGPWGGGGGKEDLKGSSPPTSRTAEPHRPERT